MKRSVLCFLAALSLTLPGVSAFAQENTQPQTDPRLSAQQTPPSSAVVPLTQQAKMSMASAEAVALRAVPGNTTEIELEREEGRLVYSVSIEQPNKKAEVKIDANTCQLIKVETESESSSSSQKESG